MDCQVRRRLSRAAAEVEAYWSRTSAEMASAMLLAVAAVAEAAAKEPRLVDGGVRAGLDESRGDGIRNRTIEPPKVVECRADGGGGRQSAERAVDCGMVCAITAEGADMTES